ncbi:MAG: PAS domain S-box protein [Leptolyngbya sp.]|nr:PAS domain S-box protein [Candidatus Melainabacteria bacterium]
MPRETRDMVGVDVTDSTIQRAERTVDVIEQMTKGDDQQKVYVERLKESRVELFELIHDVYQIWLAELHHVKSNFIEPRIWKTTLRIYGEQFYDSIDAIVKREESQLRAANFFGTAIIAVNVTLLSAAIVTILMAGFLWYTYAVSIKKPLQHLIENGRLLSLQYPLLKALPDSDEFGKLDALLHLTSQEIAEALARERAVIDNAADLICIVDEDLKFFLVNSFSLKLLGVAPDQLLGTFVNSHASAEQSFLADEFLRNTIGLSDLNVFELRLITASSQTVETRWTCSWSASERKLFCVVHDVTEEKRVEQLKQDFTDMISRDLRSPLISMCSSLRAIENGSTGEIPADAKIAVSRCGKNVNRLLALVDDLLDFQKLKAGKMELVLEPSSIQSIIQDAVELVTETVKNKGVKLILPEGETVLNVDRNKLTQTCVNLISNAVKFSEPGGEVIVDLLTEDGFYSLCVSDCGPGVPEGFAAKIFEPFEQAPSSKAKEGTGLGLAICKLIVEAHGGTISVGDNMHGGKGSTFMVTLQM